MKKVEEIKLDVSNVDLANAPVGIEMPKIKLLSEMTKKELMAICDSKGIVYGKKPNNATLIELIEKGDAPVMSMDNKPVSAGLVNNTEENIPANFINVQREKKDVNDVRSYKGRFYKVLSNGYAMWTDNGVAFNLNEIV